MLAAPINRLKGATHLKSGKKNGEKHSPRMPLAEQNLLCKITDALFISCMRSLRARIHPIPPPRFVDRLSNRGFS